MKPSESRLTLPNDPFYVGLAARFAEELALRSGFGADDAAGIRAAVDEACAYVLRHDFEAGESGHFRLSLGLTGRALVVRVRDRGLPMDPSHPEHPDCLPDRLGIGLMKALMDEVRFVYHGRRGNEVRLTKYLKGAFRITFPRPAGRVEVEPNPQVEIRRALPQEAIGVTRCLYRAYGYDYTGSESAYSPDWIAQMNESGDQISAVAVAPGGEVVGHAALARYEDTDVYDLCQGAVVPAYRSQGLLRQMIAFLVEEARRLEIARLYAEPVTFHPYSQRVLAPYDFVESGLLLGSVPADEQARGLELTVRGRITLMPCVCSLSPEPSRLLFGPPRYRLMLAQTIERMGLRRDLAEPSPKLSRPARGRLTPTLMPLMQRGVVRVTSVGEDSWDELLQTLRDLLAEQVAVLHVDLDLADAFTPELCDELNQRGFFYGAYLPSIGGTDVLRLQYLNHLELTRTRPMLVNSWARQLYDFILDDRQQLSPL
ncbi:MAG: GNAT family N-acetyltransferase [Candidatus Eremiobacteraeota bacterium]|nr:GNAT family N-acetyltransferase [Candidatus Eremiobacteraeota bacterium]